MIVFYCATIVPIVRIINRALGPYIIYTYIIYARVLARVHPYPIKWYDIRKCL